jgi:hypothetical protein
LDNKYCATCGLALNESGAKGVDFEVITVSASHRDAAARKTMHKEMREKTLVKALEWVMRGGEPPPEYKPATVVGRNASMSRNPYLNLFTGAREYLLIRNDPGPIWRRIMGMDTLRVCRACYDENYKGHPKQLQQS